MKKKLLISILLFFFLFIPSKVFSAMDETTGLYLEGIESFENANYPKAIKIFDKLIDELRLNTVERIITAHSILGASRLYTGDLIKAKDHFWSVLDFSSDHNLDPDNFAPRAIRLFNEVKKERNERIERYLKEHGMYKEEPTPAAIPPTPPPPATKKSEKPKEAIQAKEIFEEQPQESMDPSVRNPLSNSFLPFGMAQFKNDEPSKGYIYLATQIFTLASALTTISIYYGMRNADGTFDNSTLSRGLKAGFYTSITFYLYSTLAGMADSLINRKEYPYAHKKKNSASFGIIIDKEGGYLAADLRF